VGDARHCAEHGPIIASVAAEQASSRRPLDTRWQTFVWARTARSSRIPNHHPRTGPAAHPPVERGRRPDSAPLTAATEGRDSTPLRRRSARDPPAPRSCLSSARSPPRRGRVTDLVRTEERRRRWRV
jgi:hypothetical protein